MARVVLLVLLLACLALAQDTTFIPAVLLPGFETIFTNDTSFIDEIDLHGTNIYVASEGDVKEVTLDPFQLSYRNKFFNQAQRFVDFRAFDDTANPPNTWVFGPTNARGVNGDFTVNHPVQLAALTSNDTQVLSNLLLSAVTVRAVGTTPTQSTTVAYLAGWDISNGANFVVTSLTLNPTQVAGGTHSFAILAGTAALYNGNYSDFSRPFKPRIFRSHVQPYVIVVDPNTRTVYKINTEDNTFTLTYAGAFYPLPGHVAGVTYDHDNGRLFVGIHERGTFASSIVVINTDSLTLNMTINLNPGESYPKALSYRNNLLYAGINGGHSILQIDVSKVNGSINYATLPWYLRSIYSLVVSPNGTHVYFGTYEQRAKVARVRTSDFCISPCDSNFGYCQAARDVVGANGECQCIPGYLLNQTNGWQCLENTTVVEDITQNSLYKQARAGNVALGLLFAAAFIAAAIGWFLLWRHKKGDSGSGSKRYSQVAHTEEHENFLGGDE